MLTGKIGGLGDQSIGVVDVGHFGRGKVVGVEVEVEVEVRLRRGSQLRSFLSNSTERGDTDCKLYSLELDCFLLPFDEAAGVNFAFLTGGSGVLTKDRAALRRWAGLGLGPGLVRGQQQGRLVAQLPSAGLEGLVGLDVGSTATEGCKQMSGQSVYRSCLK